MEPSGAFPLNAKPQLSAIAIIPAGDELGENRTQPACGSLFSH
jgi:hypothetical protein